MQRQISLLFLWFVIAFPAVAGESVNTVAATLRSAKVYRSGAELTHTATARLAQGNNELIIDDVSTALDPASIRVNASGSVTIMGVSFSQDYLEPKARSPLVERLQDSADELAKQLDRLDILTKSDQQLLELLHSNRNIGGAQTGVTETELAKMMEYNRQQEVLLRTELAGYAEKSSRIKGIRSTLESQIGEEEKKNTKASGRIALQLLCPLAGMYDFTISYLTTAAHWVPAYDLRVTGSSDPLQLIYKARVEQSSGIDWKHVKLSLSTSMPSQGGNAPVLTAKFLRFAEAVGLLGFGNAPMANSLSGRAAGVDVKQGYLTGKTAMIRGNNSVPPSDLLYVVDGTEVSKDAFEGIDPNTIGNVQTLNGADAIAVYGSRAGSGVVIVTLKKGIGDYTNINYNQLDVVFDIDIPYDIPSNGKEQGVELKEYKLPCVYQYYAAPVAEREAYLLGQVPGWEKLNLLPGEASIMVEGTYIGKSFIDPGSTQDTLNLTLGRDKRIVVKREKVIDFSSVKFLGSTKKEVFTYQITVRNTRKEKVGLLLKDQYPISTDKEIESELLEDSGATVNRDNGILTWKVDLAPGETRQLRFSYSIKYPKDKEVNIN